MDDGPEDGEWMVGAQQPRVKLVRGQVLVSGAAKDGGSGSRGVAVGSCHPPLSRGLSKPDPLDWAKAG